MYRAAFGALWSHWWRHKVQLFSLLLGLALATALWTGVQAINAQARATYDQAASVLAQDRYDQIRARDGQAFDQSHYVALRRSGWLVTPILEGRWRHEDIYVDVLGVEPLTAPSESVAGVGAAADLGRFITPPGQGYGAGETVALLADVPGLPPLTVSPDMIEGLILVDIGIAQALLRSPDQVSRLLVLRSGNGALPDGLELLPPTRSSDLARLTDSFHLNLTAFGFLSFAVGLLIVHAAIGLGFEQRRILLRTLRALGVPVGGLIWLLLAEVIMMAMVAGIVGVVLGYVLAAALLPDVAATLAGLYGAPMAEGLELAPSWWIGGGAVALCGALLAAAQSLWRVARLPILAPAQPRAWAQGARRMLRWQLGTAGVLAIAGVGLVLWGRGLIAGFSMLAALLLASALALPAILAFATHVAQGLARGALARWFWADTRQQLPGLSLAMMALTLALAANVGVGTMVGSFRQVFVGWLDQRLAAELYISARDEAEAVRLRAWLDGRVDAVLPIWSVDAPVAGQQVQIYGVVDHATYRDHWPILSGLDDPWDQLASGKGALINEQMAHSTDLKPGDRFRIPRGAELTVAGVYSDYGNPRGQVIIGNDLLVSLFPRVPRLRYGLRVPPERAKAVAAALVQDFGLPPAHVSQQSEIKAFSKQVFEQTFTVTAALNVLTLAVAGVAIWMSLTTLSNMRLPQLAPVWAIGLTRRQLAAIELTRAIALSALVVLVALPVGVMLGWLLLAKVNVAAFGWRIPMTVFPVEWIWLAGWAFVAAALAAFGPAWRLARLAPADLVKVFAHER